ncbi:carbohydrate binding domain-containing protein [Halobacillus litoralis]|uniref:carbohydrate binding domain-containing protein n=1 Tax=Halobacillus litoralis TaxID=45668 RepID=UPI001CFF1656|nr:carbohydrate binding domain-containing protein [Halobacillus litoralis]
MKKTFYCFMVLFIVLGAFSPVQADKSAVGDLAEDWYDKDLFEGLNNKKNESASMSREEYAVVLSHLVGVEKKEVIEAVQELNSKKVNLKSAIKHEEAKSVLSEFLAPDLEDDFNQLKDSNKPVKRIDVLQMVDGFIKGYYYKEGTYKEQEISGNAWINSDDVKLTDSNIDGNLVITSGKDILLEEVTVSGVVYINEDIQNNVKTIDSDLNRIVVYDASEKESDWSLVWSDEFLANDIDRSKWDYDIGNWIIGDDGEAISSGWGNNELEYYTDSSDNSFIEDGNLVIKAKKEPVTDKYGSYDYTSAKLKTKGLFSKKYGKFEAKMKLPEGKGFWPAFWMMPEDDVYGPWPTSGEIDIMEAAGEDPDAIGGAIHFGEEYPDNTYKAKDYHFPEGEDFTGYHTYSVEWEPGEIRWYVDGKLYQTINEWFSQGKNQGDKYAYPAPFDQEFYLILNLAVGGWYGGNPDETTEFPGEMEVDYVRVYELTGRDYREPVEPVVEEETLPEDAKQPLENGNLIYDQEYEKEFTIVDQPGKALDQTYWNFVTLPDFGGEGHVSKTNVNGETFAKTDITNPGNALWSLQQIQKLPILEGHTYEVSFDAKSNTNRTLMTKVSGGAERGYANYSGEKTMNLDENVQSYSYTFKLNQDTDLSARLEFNMGLVSSAPVWIGNVRVEDITDEVKDNKSKPALPDGNLIYNGTFDQGDRTRLNYWELALQEDASADVSVSEETREAHIQSISGEAEPGDVLFKQNGIPLQQNQEYELNFNARASEERTIQVELVSGDGSVSYTDPETISLTTAMNNHTVTFQMPETVSDEEGQLLFKLGGQSDEVYLDDVSLVDKAPLKNGDFSRGMESWSSYIHFDAGADVFVKDEALNIDIVNGGNETWSVLAEQSGLSLSKDVSYTLSFDARSTSAREIEVTLENAAYHRYLSKKAALSTEMKTYEFEFNMTADDMTSLKFLMGQFGEKHEIVIDNVSLTVN